MGVAGLVLAELFIVTRKVTFRPCEKEDGVIRQKSIWIGAIEVTAFPNADDFNAKVFHEFGFF